MKGFKKRWNDELDNIVPDLSQQVKRADISTVPQTTQLNSTAQPRGFKAWFKQNKRRFLASVASVMAAVLLAVFVVPSLANLLSTPASPTAVVVEINPSVVFSVDENGIVTKVIANNNDADILLYGGADKQMVGQRVEYATNLFVDMARRMGYITEDNNDINVYCDQDHENTLKSIKQSVTNYLNDNMIVATVNSNALMLQDLCSKVSLSVTDSLDQFVQNLSELESKFYVRLSSLEGFNIDEVYNQQITAQGVFDMVKATLEQQWNIAKQRHEDIRHIQSLAQDWILSIFAEPQKEALQQAIDAYKEKYKTDLSIDNIMEEIVEQVYNVASLVETLVATLTIITVDYIAEHTQELANLLKEMNVGYADAMLSLLNAPQTVQEYLSKMEDYCATSFQIKMGLAL